MMRSLLYPLILAFFFFFTTACSEKAQTFNQTQIDYNQTITESDVQRLGEYLIQSRFTDGTPKNIKIKKKGQTYSFKMVIRDELELTPKLTRRFGIFAYNLSNDVFNQAPVEIELCNAFFVPTKTIPMVYLGKKKSFNGTHIIYKDAVSEEEVDRFGAFLIKSQFTDGSKKDIILDRKGKRYLYKLVFNSSFTLTDHWTTTFEAFANEISKEVFNHHPVDVYILDEVYQPIKVLPFNPAQTQMKAIDPHSLGKKKVFNGTHLYYTSQIPEALAEKLGQFLNKSGFTNGSRIDVQIDYQNKVYLFRMVFNSKIPFNSTLKTQFIRFASQLSASVFMNQSVHVHLTDIFFKTIHTIPFDSTQGAIKSP